LFGGIAVVVGICLIVICALAFVLISQNRDETTQPTAISGGTGPSVTINQPTNGQVFTVGNTITVQAQATDQGSGVTRVELLVNNVVVDSQTSQNPLGEQTLAVLLDYNAAVPVDALTLTVRAYRGVTRGTDAAVTVRVQDRSAATPGTLVPTTSGGNTGTSATPIPQIPPTFNPVCRARVDVASLNFRQGPGTTYAILGAFTLGNEIPVVGRLGDNSWWQVNFNNTRGWLSAAYTTLLGTCNNVPVTTPPASPTPTVTPTQAGPAPANLVVSTLTGTTNFVLTGGEVAATYILRVKNVGGVNAGAFNVTITKPDGTVSDYTVASLSAGAEIEVPSNFTSAVFSTPGTYRLSVFVDSSGNITESSKDDNNKFLDITVSAPTPTPE
jgi:uncharacterized protein YgiM (DUF1202 family)